MLPQGMAYLIIFLVGNLCSQFWFFEEFVELRLFAKLLLAWAKQWSSKIEFSVLNRLVFNLMTSKFFNGPGSCDY